MLKSGGSRPYLQRYRALRDKCVGDGPALREHAVSRAAGGAGAAAGASSSAAAAGGKGGSSATDGGAGTKKADRGIWEAQRAKDQMEGGGA